MANAISIAGLNEVATEIKRELQTLPVEENVQPMATRMGCDVIPNVKNRMVMYNWYRKWGLTQPYNAATLASKEVGKPEEVEFIVKTVAGLTEDNIQNLKEYAISTENGNIQDSKHPLEEAVLYTVITNVGVELAITAWHGEHNNVGTTPYDSFDGWLKHIDDAKVATKVSIANGNLVNTGAIPPIANATDTVAFDRVRAFYRAAHKRLRAAKSVLYMSLEAFENYTDAYNNYFKGKPSPDDENPSFVYGSNKRCRIVPVEQMGDGSQLILTVEKNFVFGYDRDSDLAFVKVKEDNKDANIVRFQWQGVFGTVIKSFDKKVFLVNEQVNTPVDGSDY